MREGNTFLWGKARAATTAAPLDEAKIGVSGRASSGHVTARNESDRSRSESIFTCLRPSLSARRASAAQPRAVSHPQHLNITTANAPSPVSPWPDAPSDASPRRSPTRVACHHPSIAVLLPTRPHRHLPHVSRARVVCVCPPELTCSQKLVAA